MGYLLMRMRFLAILFGLLIVGRLSAQSLAVEVIPFQLINDHIIINIKINDGGIMNFMFDTGAGGTLISASAAKQLGLDGGSSRTNTGAVGTHEVNIYRGNSLTLGSLEVDGVNLMVDDKDFEEFDDGSSLDGIIGYHILSRYVVTINFDESKLYLFNPKTFDQSSAGLPYSFSLEFNIPKVRGLVVMNIGNSFEGEFLVDTGARSSILFNTPTVDNYNMVDNIGDNYVLRTTLGSSRKRTKIMFGRIEEVNVFGKSFHHVPVVLNSAREGLLSSDAVNGIIGTPLLKRFNITFDYSRGLLFVNPSDGLRKDFKTNVAGFSIYYQNGQPFIKDLIDRSAADKAGLRNGDEIISINGTLVGELKGREIRRMLQEENIRFEMVIQRNGRLKYTEFTTRSLI